MMSTIWWIGPNSFVLTCSDIYIFYKMLLRVMAMDGSRSLTIDELYLFHNTSTWMMQPWQMIYWMLEIGLISLIFDKWGGKDLCWSWVMQKIRFDCYTWCAWTWELYSCFWGVYFSMISKTKFNFSKSLWKICQRLCGNRITFGWWRMSH